MKRFLLIILTAASMLICCSCADSSVLDKPSESSETQSAVSMVYVEEKNSEQIELAKLWETLDKSEMQTFTNESGGVILTVLTD